ncbi:MAG: hypothetical protein HN981_02390 [Candidatus Pacebacteria bacterium]|jgi:hypothetical protein|nr:hypothetical protein [Candidatus Paceibacterota bacterium]MBT4651892.1 hypothetical protein [Candidatus Paceibacterota bacterium]MBT6755712.1 hypothetical protein [Candidatus Paceibacterota bacterium]MBT6921218.1 hypothetical protein [Candidatus Paceibacterota bacterium]
MKKELEPEKQTPINILATPETNSELDELVITMFDGIPRESLYISILEVMELVDKKN